MTSLAEPVQNLSLAEKVCLPQHLAAFYVFYKNLKAVKLKRKKFMLRQSQRLKMR